MRRRQKKSSRDENINNDRERTGAWAGEKCTSQIRGKSHKIYLNHTNLDIYIYFKRERERETGG